MGGDWEVRAWVCMNPDERADPEYADIEVYRGNSFLRMLKETWDAKKTSGCVTIYWRG